MQLCEMISALNDAGYSQHTIAAKVNVNQSTISRILNGGGTTYKTAKKIENFYFSISKNEKTASGH